MSLQWTVVAGFLYAEILVLFLLLLPFVSPKRWNSLFKSRFLKGLESQLIYYFYVLVAILVLLFLDAVREMRRYGDTNVHGEHSHVSAHLDMEIQNYMRLFRAQRNFYISGFSLLLVLVIKKIVALLSSTACLQAEREAAMKQAVSASRAAEAMMTSSGGSNDSGDSEDLKKELKKALEDLASAKKDVVSMKSQADNLSAEYNRLCEEKEKLEKKMNIAAEGDKKND